MRVGDRKIKLRGKGGKRETEYWPNCVQLGESPPSSRRRTADTRIVDRVDRYTTNKSEDLNARMATWGNRCWDLVSEGPRRRRKLLVSRLPRVFLSATRDSWKWTSSPRDCIFSLFHFHAIWILSRHGSKTKFYSSCIF